MQAMTLSNVVLPERGRDPHRALRDVSPSTSHRARWCHCAGSRARAALLIVMIKKPSSLDCTPPSAATNAAQAGSSLIVIKSATAHALHLHS